MKRWMEQVFLQDALPGTALEQEPREANGTLAIGLFFNNDSAARTTAALLDDRVQKPGGFSRQAGAFMHSCDIMSRVGGEE